MGFGPRLETLPCPLCGALEGPTEKGRASPTRSRILKYMAQLKPDEREKFKDDLTQQVCGSCKGMLHLRDKRARERA